MTTLEINIQLDRPNNLKYDASLFEVYTLDYGDNYHRLPDEPSSEFEKEVRNIRARYKSLSKYNDAMNLYRDWMDYLAEKHGGYDILKKKIKAGLIEDYIPRKPRLKNTSTLKYMYKHNIIVSESQDMYIDIDKVDSYLNDIYSDGINVSDVTVSVIKDKYAEKLSDEVGEVGRRITTTAFTGDEDFISSYFLNRKVKRNKKSKKKKHNPNKEKYLLTDVMNGYYDYDENDIEDSENANLMAYNGLLLNSGTTREMDVYRRLNELGWNSYKLMKRSKYSKRVASTFKPLKKGKKKKGFDVQDSYDSLIIDIIQDQGYDNYEEFEKDMLNMTSSNVLR